MLHLLYPPLLPDPNLDLSTDSCSCVLPADRGYLCPTRGGSGEGSELLAYTVHFERSTQRSAFAFHTTLEGRFDGLLEPSRTAKLIEGLPLATALIVGSVAWDEVVRLDGALRVGSHNGGRQGARRVGGGAANTAMALARAGDRPVVVSAVGQDEDGRQLLSLLQELGVDLSRVHRHAKATTRSIVLLDPRGERTIVNLARAAVPLPLDFAHIPADCCYVRSADPALTPLLAERMQSGLVVAHIPPVETAFRPAQVLVGSASDLDTAFLDDPYAAARRIAGGALEWMVITRGCEGALAVAETLRLEHRAPRVEVADSTGAGDVFAAGLVHALAAGQDMEAALRTAVAWGSASVEYEGSVPPADFAERAARLLART
jgi:ribokinase